MSNTAAIRSRAVLGLHKAKIATLLAFAQVVYAAMVADTARFPNLPAMAGFGHAADHVFQRAPERFSL